MNRRGANSRASVHRVRHPDFHSSRFLTSASPACTKDNAGVLNNIADLKTKQNFLTSVKYSVLSPVYLVLDAHEPSLDEVDSFHIELRLESMDTKLYNAHKPRGKVSYLSAEAVI